MIIIENGRGFPEVVFGEGKTAEQIISISQSLRSRNSQVLITRISKDKAEIVKKGLSRIYLP
ncbi:hypothetical protein GCM10020331_095820 [Ectobacillus funiculus]